VRGAALPAVVLLLLAPGAAAQEVARDVEPDTTGLAVEELAGLWAAPFPEQELFHVRLRVERDAAGRLRAAVRTPGAAEAELPVRGRDGWVRFQPREIPVAFHGRLRDGELAGFLYHGSRASHLRLERTGPEAWVGEVDLLHFDEPSARFYLGVSPGSGSQSAAIFLGSSRAPSFFGHDFRGDHRGFRFRDLRTGTAFRGRLAGRDSLVLEASLLGSPVTLHLAPADRIEATPVGGEPPRYAPPGRGEDDLPVADARERGVDVAHLERLVRDVREGGLPGTHAVLLAVGDALVFERYFHGYDAETAHDLRSASKSVASALVGAAVDRGLLPGADVPALRYFPRLHRLERWDPRKARITVEHLLTMSSGLDLVDADGSSAGAEWRYQLSGEEWMRFAWNVPLLSDPGATARYGSGNPLLVGGVLDRITGGTVEHFAHDALFGPLGIDRYEWQIDPGGVPYMGGGAYLRARDQLRFGLLHLRRGRWNGRRVLPEAWVDAALGRHATLEGAPQENPYGYLWWHHRYRVGDREVATVEARGAGGQYVFLVPELGVVAVVNSGNYRDRGRLRQPETILERYLLPAVLAGR